MITVSGQEWHHYMYFIENCHRLLVVTPYVFNFDIFSPVECLKDVSPQLHSMLFWTANCIELRGFLSENQDSYSSAIGSAEVMDDAMNRLSDAIIYAFEQTVYHLTKVGRTHLRHVQV